MRTGARRDPTLVVQARVIKALMLRDLRTRFFGHGLGYLIAIIWPMMHIVVLLTVWQLLGRQAPLGENPTQYFAVALVPVISYVYMSRLIMISVSNNRPLMSFQIVKLLDIIFARAILEALTLCCVVVTLMFVLTMMNISVIPNDILGSSDAFMAVLLLGVGIGSLNGLIAIKFPPWIFISIILQIIMYVSSGILIPPFSLPEKIAWYMSFNPLMHGVEWMRESFYLGYHSVVLSKTYLLGMGASFFFLALAFERIFRQALRR